MATGPSRIAALLLLAQTSGAILPSVGRAQSYGPSPTKSNDSTTTVVVLGVDHSAQLVGRMYHPGFIRAWLDRVHPAAICIERSPDEFARRDYYDFTYEAQHVAVPYARSHGLDVCPIDWLPSRDDERLAFGHLNVVDPPPVRPASGFQSFLVFDTLSLRRAFFFADSAPARAEARSFFYAAPAAGRRDFPRRLDLYRSYMQAMRILAALAAHPGDTVVVVVGFMHKDDIERTLEGMPHVRVVQPSSFALPSARSADSSLTQGDLAAILSVNLLGMQSTAGPVDWDWVSHVLDRFAAMSHGSAEARLFQTRYAVLRRAMPAAEAAAAYQTIRREAQVTEQFTFRPTTDPDRVDSYFDPFGNVSVRERCDVESGREWLRAGEPQKAASIRHDLLRSRKWSPLQEAELSVYWDRYIAAN